MLQNLFNDTLLFLVLVPFVTILLLIVVGSLAAISYILSVISMCPVSWFILGFFAAIVSYVAFDNYLKNTGR